MVDRTLDKKDEAQVVEWVMEDQTLDMRSVALTNYRGLDIRHEWESTNRP